MKQYSFTETSFNSLLSEYIFLSSVNAFYFKLSYLIFTVLVSLSLFNDVSINNMPLIVLHISYFILHSIFDTHTSMRSSPIWLSYLSLLPI